MLRWCVGAEPGVEVRVVGPEQRRWLVVLEGGFDLLVAADLEEAEWWTGQLDRSEGCVLHVDEESL